MPHIWITAVGEQDYCVTSPHMYARIWDTNKMRISSHRPSAKTSAKESALTPNLLCKYQTETFSQDVTRVCFERIKNSYKTLSTWQMTKRSLRLGSVGQWVMCWASRKTLLRWIKGLSLDLMETHLYSCELICVRNGLFWHFDIWSNVFSFMWSNNRQVFTVVCETVGLGHDSSGFSCCHACRFCG